MEWTEDMYARSLAARRKCKARYDVILFCDGSADAEGRGGAGCVMKGRYGKVRPVFKPFESGATNQKMEIMAAVLGLNYLEKTGLHILIISDSRYLCDAFNAGWIERWEKKGWRKIANRPEWETLVSLVALHRAVEFQWVRGHDGHPGNERAHMLANAGRYFAIRSAVARDAREDAAAYRASGGREQVAVPLGKPRRSGRNRGRKGIRHAE